MTTLQRFKLLATHCGAAAAASSPARSPRASPVVHLRRRKTLRMLLSRTSSDRRRPDLNELPESDGGERDGKLMMKKKEIRSRRKLKELFMSSPSPPLEERERRSGGGGGGGGDERKELLPDGGGVGGGFSARRISSGRSRRQVTASFRNRLLRRPWRPVLVTIPEQ